MSFPHTDPAAKQALKDSHVSTWSTPEQQALIERAVQRAKARNPKP